MRRISFRLPALSLIGGLALMLAACGSTVTVSTTAPSSPANPSGNPPTTPPKPTLTIVTAQQSQSGKDATAVKISVTTTCPSGTTLVSGGYDLGMANAMQLVEIIDDYPSSPNAWTVTEANPQSGGAVTLTAYAYCLKSSTAISNHIASGLSGTDGKAVAACQTNTIVTGGGFKGAGQIASSYPVLNTWHTAFEAGVVAPSPYAAYAVCVPSGLTAAPFANGSATLANNATGSANVTCPSGQTLTGGGYDNANGASPIVTNLSLTSGSFTAKELNLYVPPVTGPGGAPPTPSPLQLTAYGMCVTAA